MGVTLRLLVAAACVVSLASEALGDCISASWGNPGVSWLKLENVTVDLSGLSGVFVELPLPALLGCGVVGAAAEFCEADYLSFASDLTVLIQRDVLSLEYKGVLTSTVYCVPLITPTNKSPDT